MSLFARFSDRDLFPSFDELPSAASLGAAAPTETKQDGDGDASAGTERRWFLVAQIAENMTITKPTLILRDRDSSSFALAFEEKGVVLKGWRKEYTLIAERVRRTEGKEGKRGFVRVEEGEEVGVRCIPGPMDRVIRLGAGMKGDKVECRSCGGEGTRKCTGCGWVRYCGKECQVKGWSEGGHKGECKVYKALKEFDEAYPTGDDE
ncbi:uncharacterized protein DNG_01002 [Cephalotrichum gorgonifer]|uniref:MYND-type domain-containing protein n=1 Tax=Cephalotrichum gorgonifer TaxID=2041049 RepID=A0AAE8MQ29_9PEZI|nr:uncharacterized protein DNG_01002 [Cephalotrichum gorgonifer]